MNKKSAIILITVICVLVLAFFLMKFNKSDVKENNSKKDSSDKKILVVYFSAQSHTKSVAEKIAKEYDADLFEIVPKEVYTSSDLNYNDSNSRVSKEHEDESLRDIELTKTKVDNWEDYDTVFLGYPIWWGIAAWPLDTFVKNNDFNNKTVIPFCTSASSDLGESAELLKKEANGGNWLDGKRFNSNASTDNVKSWINELNL